jgi:hypothetical protein
MRSSKFTVESKPATSISNLDKRKKDNRKLFNVESSASQNDQEKSYDEYGDN